MNRIADRATGERLRANSITGHDRHTFETHGREPGTVAMELSHDAVYTFTDSPHVRFYLPDPRETLPLDPRETPPPRTRSQVSRWIEAHEIRSGQTGLCLRGEGRLAVHPHSANTVTVTVEDF